jgi:hypothetical protein
MIAAVKRFVTQASGFLMVIARILMIFFFLERVKKNEPIN